MSPRKIKSAQDLKALREEAASDIDLRAGKKDIRITVHMGTCGIAAGAREVLMALMRELSGTKSPSVVVTQAACAGLCDQEPMITITDKSGGIYRYGRLDRDKVREIVSRHVMGGKPAGEYLLTEKEASKQA